MKLIILGALALCLILFILRNTIKLAITIALIVAIVVVVLKYGHRFIG